MKRILTVSVILILVTGLASAADKQLVGLMMPDAKVLAGMSVAQVRTSPYGQFLLARVPANDPNFQKFTAATGFDPLRDITEIVAAAPGLHTPSGLMAIRGNFNVAQIVAFAKMTGAVVDTAQGVPIISGPDGKGSGALLDSTLAVVGDPASVAAAVARRLSPSTLDPVLTAKAVALSASQDAWAVSTMTADALGMPAPAAPTTPGQLNLAPVQNIQQSSVGVKFSTSVNFSVEAVTDTAENASALAGIVRMMVGLAQMSQSNAQLAQVAALLNNLSIQTQGPALELMLSIPEELLEQMTPAHAHGTRKVADVR